MSSEEIEKIENEGAGMYAAQLASGVDFGEVAIFGGSAKTISGDSTISAVRGGRHQKYDMAGEFKAFGAIKREALLCDYLFNDTLKLAMEEEWLDLNDKKNLKLIRAYCVLAMKELAAPCEFITDASKARELDCHPMAFFRVHRARYSKVIQMLDDWALSQFDKMLKQVI